MNSFFYWFDPILTLSSAIKKWSPTDCVNESDFKESLYEFLHETSPGMVVTKEAGLGQGKADLMIEDNLIIEMKKDLSSIDEFNRLIGQLTAYREHWNKFIVVLLIGITELNLKKRLERFVSKDHVLVFERMHIIVKHI